MNKRDLAVALLDRPGTRSLLAGIATLYARYLNRGIAGSPLRVFYDRATRAWGRSHGSHRVIDSARFRYWASQLMLAPGDTPPWVATARRLWFVDYTPQPGDVILDIGAEVGTDTVAFADAVGPSGRVVAVEAHPVTFGYLKRTVELSGLEDRVICVNAAITETAGSVIIEDGANTLRSTVVREGTGHKVRALSLDQLGEELGLGEIGLLKMNIEGAERDALQGATATIARSRHIAVAAHDFRADRGDGESYRTRDFVLRVLEAAGLTTRLAPFDPAKDPIADRDHVLARQPSPSGRG